MDDLLSQILNLIVVVIAFLIVFSILGVWAARHNRQRPRQSVRLDDVQPRRFCGQGESSVAVGELISGQYRIDYQFPDDVLVKVDLIESSTGDRELVLLKSGRGVDEFVVENPGVYRFHVEPSQDDNSWEITIKPVSLLNRLSS